MFSWFKRKTSKPAVSPPPAAPEQTNAPTPMGENPDNPGFTVTGDITLQDGRGGWQESFDCVKILARLLSEHGRTTETTDKTVTDLSTGLVLRPLFVELSNVERGKMQTVTTIEVKHPKFVPEAVFEFQHSWGATIEQSIEEGFRQWAGADFVAFVGATQRAPEDCLVMVMDLPETSERPKHRRRVVFSPVVGLGEELASESAEGEHAFCPCCLFTNSIEAHRPLLEQSGFFGLRLFAVRTPEGDFDADCRVNGVDSPAGKQGLKQYAARWKGTGLKFHRQYVIIQDAPFDDDPGGDVESPSPAVDHERELAGVA